MPSLNWSPFKFIRDAIVLFLKSRNAVFYLRKYFLFFEIPREIYISRILFYFSHINHDLEQIHTVTLSLLSKFLRNISKLAAKLNILLLQLIKFKIKFIPYANIKYNFKRSLKNYLKKWHLKTNQYYPKSFKKIKFRSLSDHKTKAQTYRKKIIPKYFIEPPLQIHPPIIALLFSNFSNFA